MEPTSPCRSPPPGSRSIMHPNHARSVSATSIPRPASRIPQSPTRTTGSTSPLFDVNENSFTAPPPAYGLAGYNPQALNNITNTANNLNGIANGHGFKNEMSASQMMPPPSKAVTASIQKSRSMSINNSDTSKRESLADRAAKPSGIVAPKAVANATKTLARSSSQAPGTAYKAPLIPRPKSSLERVRPPNFNMNGTGGGMTRSMSSASNKGPSRPPSAQEIRSLDDDAMISGKEMNRRLKLLEEAFKAVRVESTSSDRDEYKEKYETERIRVVELETGRAAMESQISFAKMELEQAKLNLLNITRALEDERRDRRTDKEDAIRRFDREIEDIKRRAKDELESAINQHQQAMESLQRTQREAIESLERQYQQTIESQGRKHKDELETTERRYKQQLEDEKAARTREVNEITTQAALEKQRLETKMDSKWAELRRLKEDVENAQRDLERERLLNNSLRDSLAEQNAAGLSTETTIRALKVKIEQYEIDAKEKLARVMEMEEKARLAEEETRLTREKLRAEETLRRKLHNQVQELKGNIRVFCRVRPPLGVEAINAAEIKFPDIEGDARGIEIIGQEKSALGTVATKAHPFQFDRVFGPTCQNNDVFEEISQLVQSALDGYNVCIFCYGQTGSGKTYTMSSKDGMIPQAVHQIYDTAKSLEEKGWQYQMEGSFVEIYNENLNDLLGKSDDLDKKKHEIRHDPKELKTTVTGLTSVILDTPSRVEQLLRTADTNRSVAATKANERSSRSHSVFMLRLTGYNSITLEKSEGTLNLVDLAGSERLSHSQASGDRLKETQSINRSLACLGDVIAALGSGKDGAHIPYRNSKLTYLLQYSLGGNSKTLMFVMVSPMQAHLQETLTSLKFATKVSNTYIGTARKTITSGK